jgi:FKBP-type peptidyl-prolyl cis-trans isomerase (trigger factor)
VQSSHQPFLDGEVTTNMRVLSTEAEGLRHVLRIAVSTREIEAAVEARLGEMRQRVRMPGFRAGKVPITVLRERYGAAVTKEVVEGVMKEAAERAVREQGLRPALVPQIELLPPVKGGEFEFRLTVDVLPEIPAVDVGALEMEQLTAEVTDVDVDRWLEQASVPLVSGAEDADPDRRRQVARQQLDREVARLARMSFRRQLFDRLASTHAFSVPHGLVEREFATIWNTAQATGSRDRAGPAEEEAEVRARFRAIAERRVRLGLLLTEIARRHGIDATGGSARLEERVVDLVREQARVVPRFVPFEELVRLAEG